MFAILAAVLFGAALLLDVLNTGGEAISALTLAGLLALALHFVVPVNTPWRRTP